MSTERCEAVKQLLKQAIKIMESGVAGKGRGISLAITYVEDAVLRVDYHMREQGLMLDPTPPITNGQRVVPRANNLVPAAPIPQLNTGLMQQTPVKKPVGRPPKNPTQDLDLLD